MRMRKRARGQRETEAYEGNLDENNLKQIGSANEVAKSIRSLAKMTKKQ